MIVRESEIEAETLRIARLIFRRIESRGLVQRARGAVEGAIVRPVMHDEELRFRILRFVDVYPSLKDERQIATHLHQHLHTRQLSVNGTEGPLLRLARRFSRPGPLVRKPAAWASRFAIESIGQQFIAGENIEEVAARIRTFERRGFLFSVDLLGEFVASDRQAEEFATRYLDTVENLGAALGDWQGAGPRVNLSVKLSSLTSHFDPMDPQGTSASVLSRLIPLFRAARKQNAFINIDMEKYEYRDLTLSILQELLSSKEFSGFPDVGIVMQAYLRDAEETLENLLAWLNESSQPITIRLVKGAYWDSEQIWARQKGWPVPVLTNKRETDAQFERMTRRLLAQPAHIRTAIASHNVRSIAHALAMKRLLRVTNDRFEIQMLFGMAGPIAEVLARAGIPVRIYMPCGELIPGMAYLVRRILENTSNESFLRQRFVEKQSEEILLRNPNS